MLTHDELLSLSHLLRNDQVLSIYIDGTNRDPAQRHAWRVQLNQSLDAARQSLAGTSHDTRTAFDDCVALLENELATLADSGSVRAPGFIAFITRTRVHLAERVAATMPTAAIWGTGPYLTPYVRALKQSRPVVIVVADARASRIYQYRSGVLLRNDTIHTHAVTPEPSHMGAPPSPGYHGGTRGATGEAGEQRAHLAATERMLAEAAGKAVTLAGHDGWIVVGGVARTATQLTRRIAQTASERVQECESLDVHSTDAEIAAAAQTHASLLRDAYDSHQVADVIAAVEAGAAGTLGAEATRYALEQACVRELYFTEHYVRDNGWAAEEMVRAAMAQNAKVEEVVRDVATHLDAYGGIAARLRYPLTTRGASVPITTAESRSATPEMQSADAAG